MTEPKDVAEPTVDTAWRPRPSLEDRTVLSDLSPDSGFHLARRNNSMPVDRFEPGTLWTYVLRRVEAINITKLSGRQIEALGFTCFGERAFFAHECWRMHTVEALQAMLSMVQQQALTGLLLSKRTAALMRWTKPGGGRRSRPVNHKNAQEYVREALNRLEVTREEIVVMLAEGLLEEIEWALRGRWSQRGLAPGVVLDRSNTNPLKVPG